MQNQKYADEGKSSRLPEDKAATAAPMFSDTDLNSCILIKGHSHRDLCMPLLPQERGGRITGTDLGGGGEVEHKANFDLLYRTKDNPLTSRLKCRVPRASVRTL